MRKLYSIVKIGGLCCVLGLALTSFSLDAKEVQADPVLSKEVSKTKNHWQEFRSINGECCMKFPKYPDHLSEKLRLPEIGFDLKYDAYISAIDQKTTFLLLIAQYPDFVDQTYANKNLEGFVEGLLKHNPGLTHELSLVNGHTVLDLFICKEGMYFKGRALMVKNSFYLMAMECEAQYYDEASYKTFIDSFELMR